MFRRLNFFASARPAYSKHSVPRFYEGAAIAAKKSLHVVALSGSASSRLSPERRIIFVLRSRKLLLLVLRLRSVLHTLVGMVMRMLV
jgi:hypothetical protein